MTRKKVTSTKFVCSDCRNPTFTLELASNGYNLCCSKCGFLEWADITRTPDGKEGKK